MNAYNALNQMVGGLSGIAQQQGLLGGGQIGGAAQMPNRSNEQARRTVQLAIQSGHVSLEDMQAGLELSREGGAMHDIGYVLRLLLTAEIERRKGNV